MGNDSLTGRMNNIDDESKREISLQKERTSLSSKRYLS
jgi:hypothetical protein